MPRPEQRRGRWEEMLDEDSAAVVELTAMYVHPDSWGTGTGRALMTAALDTLPSNSSEMTLWVLEANARARRFYEAAGWTIDGSVKLYETGGSSLPAVRYRLGLGELTESSRA